MSENKTRVLTCIICPRGCELSVTLSAGEGDVSSVTGNACKRGLTYARTECVSPMRTVTTTARCECGAVIPVKTDSPVPKALVLEVVRVINATRVPCKSKIGDRFIKNVLNTGANVVATANSACEE